MDVLVDAVKEIVRAYGCREKESAKRVIEGMLHEMGLEDAMLEYALAVDYFFSSSE